METIQKERDMQAKHEDEIRRMNDDKKQTQQRHDNEMKQLRDEMYRE